MAKTRAKRLPDIIATIAMCAACWLAPAVVDGSVVAAPLLLASVMVTDSAAVSAAGSPSPLSPQAPNIAMLITIARLEWTIPESVARSAAVVRTSDDASRVRRRDCMRARVLGKRIADRGGCWRDDYGHVHVDVHVDVHVFVFVLVGRWG